MKMARCERVMVDDVIGKCYVFTACIKTYLINLDLGINS